MTPRGRLAALLRPALSAWMAVSPLCVPAASYAAIRVAAPSAATTPGSAAGGAQPFSFRAAPETAVGVGGVSAAGALPSLQTISPALSPKTEADAVSNPAAAAPLIEKAPVSGVAVEQSVTPALPGARISEEPAPAPKAKTNFGVLNALSVSEAPSVQWDGARPFSDRASTRGSAASGRRWDAASRAVPEAPMREGGGARSGLRPAFAPPEEAPSGKPAESRRRAADIRIPKQTFRRLVLDSITYYYVTLSSLNWYTFPRLIERWKGMKEGVRETNGKERAVSDFMGFFIAHRVLGSTGNYAPMGFRIAANRAVVHDAWLIFDKYFKKDAAAEEAFRRFIRRAKLHNPNRRSTQFRKIIFHALRAGSVMSPSELPAFFDTLATPADGEKLARYQGAPQQKVLDAFERIVNETILEVNRDKKPGRRIVGALLLGSFANHAAGPESDLDVQLLSEDGSPFGIKEVMDGIKTKWNAEGLSRHPIGGFQYALPLSKNLLMRIHVEPYMIFSPYPKVLKTMRLTPEEETASPSTVKTLRGFLFVTFYSWFLRGALGAYEAYDFLKSLLFRG